MRPSAIKALGLADFSVVLSRRLIAVPFMFMALSFYGYYFKQDRSLIEALTIPIALFIFIVAFLSPILTLTTLIQSPLLKEQYRTIKSWKDIKDFNRRIWDHA